MGPVAKEMASLPVVAAGAVEVGAVDPVVDEGAVDGATVGTGEPALGDAPDAHPARARARHTASRAIARVLVTAGIRAIPSGERR